VERFSLTAMICWPSTTGISASVLVEEADQIEAVACLRGHREHVIFVNFQAGEQALRAIACVFMLPPGRAPGSGQHVRLGRRLGLNASLLGA